MTRKKEQIRKSPEEQTKRASWENWENSYRGILSSVCLPSFRSFPLHLLVTSAEENWPIRIPGLGQHRGAIFMFP